jgi:hypothetical protein
MSTDLPTTAQLGLILHRMLVDIRNLSFQPGEEKWINYAADVAEIIPLQFINRDEGYLEMIAEGLRDWAAEDPRARRFAAVLEMSEDEVIRTLVANHKAGGVSTPPEPVQV